MSARTEPPPADGPRDLYELCPNCGGAGVIASGYLRHPCHRCEGQKFIKAGITMDQVDKIIRENESLKDQLREGGRS